MTIIKIFFPVFFSFMILNHLYAENDVCAAGCTIFVSGFEEKDPCHYFYNEKTQRKIKVWTEKHNEFTFIKLATEEKDNSWSEPDNVMIYNEDIKIKEFSAIIHDNNDITLIWKTFSPTKHNPNTKTAEIVICKYDGFSPKWYNSEVVTSIEVPYFWGKPPKYEINFFPDRTNIIIVGWMHDNQFEIIRISGHSFYNVFTPLNFKLKTEDYLHSFSIDLKEDGKGAITFSSCFSDFTFSTSDFGTTWNKIN